LFLLLYHRVNSRIVIELDKDNGGCMLKHRPYKLKLRKSGIVVLVCGGRDYDDKYQVWCTLDLFKPIIGTLVEGGARGADRLAGEWAEDCKVPHICVPADWTKYGKRAGPIRNRKMLDECKPELVIAFSGGTGTANMMDIASEAGVTVLQVRARSAQKDMFT
jgi:YspA, cpYpsA-related SLOG family